MTTIAIVMMIITMGVVTAFTGYFFWKVLKTPPKVEPDSFSQNDDVKR